MRSALCLLTALFGGVSAGWAASSEVRSPERLSVLLAEMDRLGPTDDRKTAVDREAAQKDAWRSRLFWHTDFDQAVKAATAAGKPILSLRLLGRLDEELSCANSRFFRKTLYVDPEVAALLRAKFILHWESVRPVPVVTIDFGDGRVTKRTLTGNSVHYLLAPDGRVLDALPGLLNAETFRRELTAFADEVATRPQTDPSRLVAYYETTLQRLQSSPVVNSSPRGAAADARRPADRAGRVAVSKLTLQLPLLRGTRNPSQAVLSDTLSNQRSLRPRIIAWLRTQPAPDMKSLNERVYRELFLSPLDDPMMGLSAPDEAALFPSQQSSALQIPADQKPPNSLH